MRSLGEIPMAKKWYVIHTYSGYEAKVKASIEERLQALGLQDKISQIIVPMGRVEEIKKGKRKVSPRKFFPGYILVEMDITEETWHLIKNIPKVTGFLGDQKNPTPLSEAEIQNILAHMKEDTDKPKPKVMFDKGEDVRIIDGPFANFSGVIDEINADRGKLKVMVSIFGRATPVELEFVQVEKS